VEALLGGERGVEDEALDHDAQRDQSAKQAKK